MRKTLPAKPDSTPFGSIEWRVEDGLTSYPDAIAEMEARVRKISAGEAPQLVWLLEHPALYTGGTSARAEDLLQPDRFPVYQTGRGGQFTYHGPGQRVCYVMLDLNARGQDVHRYVCDLETWIIRALDQFNVKGERRDDRVGIWVPRGQGREDKIAAIGVRIRRWVSFHGIAVNVEPNLEHFSGIVPCGIDPGGGGTARYGVTSLVDLGLPVTVADLDVALKETFAEVFDASPIP